MDTCIYKTLAECATLEVSGDVYVVSGSSYSCENIFPSNYYVVRHYDSGSLIRYYNSSSLTGHGEYFDEMEMFSHLVKAVTRRGLTAVISDSFESDSWSGGQPMEWTDETNRPTFRVDGILCVCTKRVDDKYSFLPLSEFIKQLRMKKKRHDEECRRDYLSGNY